jgi:diguanylate cyclase (GGDEF)-like protein
VSFSAMLKSIVGEDGIVVRYGGDEFIIIIPNKNVNYGESIANKIFRNIGYNRGFVKAIESTITGKISISDENRITCSIGIASGVVKEYDDISVILKKADKALYAVKNGSKHDYKIWEE